MKKMKSTFSIPGLSFAWKRTLGIAQRRQKLREKQAFQPASWS